MLFKEDFSSPKNLFDALGKMVIQPRLHDPVIWEPEIQNFVIAGLFSLTYSLFSFPLRTLHETSEALYHLTVQQAEIFNQYNIPRRVVTGPAGTGGVLTLVNLCELRFSI